MQRFRSGSAITDIVNKSPHDVFRQPTHIFSSLTNPVLLFCQLFRLGRGSRVSLCELVYLGIQFRRDLHSCLLRSIKQFLTRSRFLGGKAIIINKGIDGSLRLCFRP